MASDEVRKKWGTIFMGDREASVEQLSAMQEPLMREKLQQEQTEDYMERVRKRAADRAREILGAAYAERLKVLEEAKTEAEAEKGRALRATARMKADGEAARKEAEEELEKARAAREEAEALRDAAREEGLRQGMDQAEDELREFRAELGQSLGRLLKALDAQRKRIADIWRDELVALAQTAAAAGSGFVLQKEHKAILRSLVIQAINQLENRASITVRVNPSDEASVADMFNAARECVPDLRQWIVQGDENIEPGGLIVESGSGRVDLRRENFRSMVDNILTHLSLPIQESEEQSDEALRELLAAEEAGLAKYSPPEKESGKNQQEQEDASAPGEAREAPEGASPADSPGALSPEEAAALAGQAPDETPEAQVDSPDASPRGSGDGAETQAEAPAGAQPQTAAAGEAGHGGDGGQPLPETPPASSVADRAKMDDGQAQPEPDESAAYAGTLAAAMEAASPSLAELEEELFPLDEGEKN